MTKKKYDAKAGGATVTTVEAETKDEARGHVLMRLVRRGYEDYIKFWGDGGYQVEEVK